MNRPTKLGRKLPVVYCGFCGKEVIQNFVIRKSCTSDCSRKLIYFKDRLNGKNCTKAMKIENRTKDMDDFIQYTKQMIKTEPAIFYDMYCKYLRTKPMPVELRKFVDESIPLPRPGSHTQTILVKQNG